MCVSRAWQGENPASRVSALSRNRSFEPYLLGLARGSAPEAQQGDEQEKGLITTMPLYEHVFLTRQDASNTQVDQLTEQFKSVIGGLGGKVGKTEYWGVKSLAFRIKKNR